MVAGREDVELVVGDDVGERLDAGMGGGKPSGAGGNSARAR